MSIRPPHPEHHVSQILELHRRCVERIDRLRAAGYEIHEHLEAASADLDELDRRSVFAGKGDTLLAHVLQRTLDAAPGTPRAQNLDGGGGTLRTDEDGHIIMRSDPTGDGATQGDIGARDRAELLHHLEAVNRHLDHYQEFPVEHAKVIRRSADRLVCVTLNWLPRKARDAERMQTDDVMPDGCESCARNGGHWSGIEGTPWEAMSGAVCREYALCGPCKRWARHEGELPPMNVLRRFHEQDRMPRRPKDPSKVHQWGKAS